MRTSRFNDQDDRDKLHAEGFTNLVQLKRFTDKDIRGLYGYNYTQIDATTTPYKRLSQDDDNCDNFSHATRIFSSLFSLDGPFNFTTRIWNSFYTKNWPIVYNNNMFSPR